MSLQGACEAQARKQRTGGWGAPGNEVGGVPEPHPGEAMGASPHTGGPGWEPLHRPTQKGPGRGHASGVRSPRRLWPELTGSAVSAQSHRAGWGDGGASLAQGTTVASRPKLSVHRAGKL